MIDNTINIINLGPGQPAKSFNVNIPEQYIRRTREERVLSVCEQSKVHKFSVRFWEGIIAEKGCIGVSKSFKKIILWAKESNLDYVIIGEDDLVFSAPGAWQYYLSSMPSDFDLYLGGVYYAQIEKGRIVNGYSGNTLVTIHSRFYDFILADNINDHLDRWLGNYACKYKYLVCEPFVVYQMDGYSDNHRRQTRHSGYKEGMVLFS